MGQGPSSGEALLGHVEVFKKIATLTYEQFVQSVHDLNAHTKSFTDSRGKQLQFEIMPGVEEALLWKATVRIACSKVNTRLMKVETTRILNLKQYMDMYKEITEQLANVNNVSRSTGKALEPMSASIMLDDVMGQELPSLEDECCICMEQKADLELACQHKFCENCIDSWNVSHRTCPLCRKRVGSDDTWVLTERPDTSDYATDVNCYLVGLADRQKRDST